MLEMSINFFLYENDNSVFQPDLKDCRKNLSQRQNPQRIQYKSFKAFCKDTEM